MIVSLKISKGTNNYREGLLKKPAEKTARRETFYKHYLFVRICHAAYHIFAIFFKFGEFTSGWRISEGMVINFRINQQILLLQYGL